MPLDDVKTAATTLATANLKAKPGVTKVYWFPHETEIRLVEAGEDTIYVDVPIDAFYFAPKKNMPYPAGVDSLSPKTALRLPFRLS